MDINTMKAIIQTLNTIEVRGRHNLEAVLGIIWTLENEIKAAQQAEAVTAGQKPQEDTHGE